MVDACESEQSALLKRYVLDKKDELAAFETRDDSAVGPNSISPFVPCAASRIPYILQAARITKDDVLWDLGCGDGIVLIEAAKRCGCRCVGVDIDTPCIELARVRAKEAGVDHLCHFEQRDLLKLPEGGLGRKAAEVAGDPSALPPTVALAFLTGRGLVLLAPWLRQEWESEAHRKLRLVTCVESLDSAVNYEECGSMFAEPNQLGWTVCKDHEKWGVFVVPPFGMTVDDWRAEVPRGTLPLQLTRAEADATRPVIIKNLLSDEDIGLIHRLVEQYRPGDAEGAEETSLSLFDLADEAAFHVAAEDALHDLKYHRVLHLHSLVICEDEASGLPALERKMKEAMMAHDEYGMLKARDFNVRSFEYHSYCEGGSVMDPHHRDDGSLLTMSVLLSNLTDFQGGRFLTYDQDKVVEHHLDRGDAVLFLSEKRHNVTPVTGDRRTLIMELWEGPRNRHNRHV
eukprot:CAMPEP_0206467598 /NCGR_PEP_ID=MMETSP0324_2-20121206/29130_1 /ASSEMBLY_ACC=CAM_ASM_000836 /TAXON_ID=2866 /ORGANISM="Crypthecodinium cohnii, Strain Seligo" /LENGTH=456 /DNA_ID=CAMNT_0053940897 /DNA_START=12 /DNA_END=1382 /DNA_ORIENTATION=-